MKEKITYSILTALACAPLAHAEWITIADMNSYQAGWGEAELNSAGWVYQDGDYFNTAGCVDGTIDCTAYRAVVSSPFSPAAGSDKAFEIRSGVPGTVGLVNSVNNTSHLLPQAIPADGIATLFVRFALENAPGNRFLVVSDSEYPALGPVLETGQTLNGFNQNIIMQMKQDYTFNVHQNNYVPVIVNPNDANAHVLESGVWYDLWLHIDNQTFAGGDGFGGRYDLYIRGGKFGTEPLHLFNTVTNAFTDWSFRRSQDRPLINFNIIAQQGNASANNGTGAFWMNSLAMFPGEFTLTTPDAGVVSPELYLDTWEIEASGWTDTGDWMGWLYVTHAPWVFSDSLDGWIYIEADGFDAESGGWTYVLK